MALINCKECGFKISDKAAICVHCGAPVAAPAAGPAAAPAPAKKKPKPLWARLLVPIVAAIITLLALIKTFPDAFEPLSSTIGLGVEKPPAIAPAPPTPPVSAARLSRDYKTNEASADIAYKGKSLLVNGVVDAINKNSEIPSVILSGGAAARAVQAQFPKTELDKLSPLKQGQKITLTCVGAGTVNGSPILKGCTLIAL